MNKVYKHIMENIVAGKIDRQAAVEMLAMLKHEETRIHDDIAIIGMALNFPFASCINEYWNNIINGVDCVNFFAKPRKKDVHNYVKSFMSFDNSEIGYLQGAYLDDISSFDYKFFKLSPKEASLMDPSQRMFLKTAWHTIEDAGYAGDRLRGTKTGLYIGYSSNSDYQKYGMDPNPEFSMVKYIAI